MERAHSELHRIVQKFLELLGGRQGSTKADGEVLGPETNKLPMQMAPDIGREKGMDLLTPFLVQSALLLSQGCLGCFRQNWMESWGGVLF
jgi:hypothetical protein